MPHNLQVVLIEPEIPNNTGSIGRLCLATQSTLHLVEPLGFEINDTQLKRAGLDYWQHLDVVRHPNLDAFFASVPKEAPLAFFSKKAKPLYSEHSYQPGSYLIFGKETKGLSDALMNHYSNQTFRIPLYDSRVRSLNLANAVSVVVYEAIRQLGS
jgi:tRNA (cytidine/uridine-2'-O-)-methyltransferase